ncbi:MAG: hypothetical protein EHM89_10255, partial [Acidobacteria bacterium]
MRVVFIAAVLAVLCGVGVLWIMRPAASPPPPRMRLALGLPKDHRVRALTLSPDGRVVAYTTDVAGPSQIALRS